MSTVMSQKWQGLTYIQEAIILLKERISTIEEMLMGYLIKHLGLLGQEYLISLHGSCDEMVTSVQLRGD